MANLRKKFSQLYDQFVEKIYRFIFLKVNSREVAEDLTSETFLRAFKVFKNQKIENPAAFLYKIARNLVVDHYRKEAKLEIVSSENSPLAGNDLEEKIKLNSDFDQVRLALFNLKDDYQTVIIWHYLDNLSISEIAKILEKPEGTIRVMLHRALKSLKNQLNQPM